jgi:hypothetical protein
MQVLANLDRFQPMSNNELLRMLVAPAVVGLLVACGGGGGGGPTGVPVDEIAGSYTITHTVVVAGFGTFSCPGTMTITQNGNSFSGTIAIAGTGDCAQFNSQGTISGTVSSSGVLAFAVSLPIVEGLISACEILSGVNTFAGSATSTGVTGTRTNQIRCQLDPETVFEGEFTYTIAGTKT